MAQPVGARSAVLAQNGGIVVFDDLTIVNETDKTAKVFFTIRHRETRHLRVQLENRPPNNEGIYFGSIIEKVAIQPVANGGIDFKYFLRNRH